MANLVRYSEIQSSANYAIPKFDADLKFDEGGKWIFVSFLDKLIQNIQAELTLILDTDRDIGNEVYKTLEGDTTNVDFMRLKIQQDFYDALVRIVVRQDQDTPAEERLSEIVKVEATIPFDDRTRVEVYMEILNILDQEVVFSVQVNLNEFSLKLI